jgi:hypothetical protein
MPWEELGKSKVSIDQSNPGISNAVALTGSNVVLDTKAKFIKTPTSSLIFERVAVSGVARIAKSYVPGKSYGLEHGWVSMSEDVWETSIRGINFAAEGNGYCGRMVVWPDESICAVTSTDKVVTMADMNSNQVVTLESLNGIVSNFVNFYCDGLNRIVLIGEYATSATAKNLYLSLDGGATFSVIKVCDTLHTNNHWHGVAYDPYSGAIWAAQGDGANSKIYFTYDFGVTWHAVDTGTKRYQPTLIQAFPDKVVFGRDSGKPGADVYYRTGNEQPTTITDIETLFEFRTNLSAANFYPTVNESPMANANEMYIQFRPYSSSNNPGYIYGTGDGGNTWHVLFTSNSLFNNSLEVVGDYIVGSGSTGMLEELRGCWRAKLPGWV